VSVARPPARPPFQLLPLTPALPPPLPPRFSYVDYGRLRFYFGVDTVCVAMGGACMIRIGILGSPWPWASPAHPSVLKFHPLPWSNPWPGLAWPASNPI